MRMAQTYPAAAGSLRNLFSTRSWSTAKRRPEPVSCSAQLDSGGSLIRVVPIAAGVLGISSVVLNRLASGIEPALLASSGQSRADVIVIFISALLSLTGLQWLALKPKAPTVVELDAEQVRYFEDSLPAEAVQELQSAWAAIQWATDAKFMVVFRSGRCIAHVGCMPPGHDPSSARPGPLCTAVQQKGAANYLANLSLFPGRFEFFSYLPTNTQSLLMQPCGEQGVVVIGSGTQRAFTTLDQAWTSAWNDKVDVTLSQSPL